MTLNLGALEVIKYLSCWILTRAFRNWPKELHSISGSEKIASPSFLAEKTKCNYSEFYQGLSGYCMIVMSYIVAIKFTRKIL